MHQKEFNIRKNLKYDGHQRRLASMVYKVLHKKTSSSGFKNENFSNKELAEELHKPVIRKIKKEKYTHFLHMIFQVLILLICN